MLISILIYEPYDGQKLRQQANGIIGVCRKRPYI